MAIDQNSAADEIGRALREVRRRIRRAQWQRGGLVVATVALAGVVVMMAVDFLVSPLRGWMRWGMFVAWLGALGWAMRIGFSPLLRKIELVRVARWIEERHPEMEERVSTALELAGGGGGVSAELLELIRRAAVRDLGGLDAPKEVHAARTSRRWARPAAALSAGLLLVLAVWPGEAGRLLVRAVVPFSGFGTAATAQLSVEPGDLEVMAGGRIEITARFAGTGGLSIELEMADGATVSQAMERRDGSHVYVLEPARQGFRYRVRTGRQESDAFTARVWPLPMVVEPRRAYEFPQYTGWARSELPLGRGVAALAGTRVVVSGGLNTAVESAWLEVAGKRLAEGSVEQAAGGGRVAFSWTLAAGEGGEARVILRHRLGHEVAALGFPVEVLEDLPPVVRLLSPQQKDVRVRPDERLPLRYAVDEDVAVAAVWVEVDAGRDGTCLLDQVLPDREQGSAPPRFLGEAAMAVGAIRGQFGGTRDFRLRIKARDGRPAEFSGPGEGFSEWLRVTIDEGAESLARQELRQEHDHAKEAVTQTLRDIRQAQQQMARQMDEIRQEQPSEQARQELAEAAATLAQAETDLREVAPQIKAGIHAAKADQVKMALDAVAESRAELEAAPLQDESVQRAAKLDQAQALADAAAEALEQARQEMDEDNRQVQDLATLNELAQRQSELARQAEEHAATAQAGSTTPEEWRQRQTQMQSALQNQLRERPDARAGALAAQAEAAAGHADHARALAEAQQALQQQASAAEPELADKQAAAAAATGQFAAKLNSAPQVEPNAAMQQAAQAAQQATAHAETAAQQGNSGQLTESAAQHAMAAEKLARSAESLESAATDAADAAARAAAQPPNPNLAPAPPQDLATAFEQATAAATPSAGPSQAAEAASQAAEALARATREARAAMQGKPAQAPGPPGEPAGPEPAIPGNRPREGNQPAQASPGVPPELAKLGISAADWEKIQSSLKSDVGSPAATGVPEEYRELVKGYFENLSKSQTKP